MKQLAPHKQALRRLAADLAERPDGEIAGVLHRLAPDRQRHVQALLREIREASAPARQIPAGLSPWLADRLAPQPGPAITGSAAQALRRCAAALGGAPVATETDRPSLLSRLLPRKHVRAA